MENKRIIFGNQSFFCVAVGLTMCHPTFAQAVIESIFEPVNYAVSIGDHSGYIYIDSTQIHSKNMVKDFVGQVRGGLINKVSYDVPCSIKGDLATETEVTVSGYIFNFKISKYERDMNHGFELIEDPSSLPDNENLGRFVELKITAV